MSLHLTGSSHIRVPPTLSQITIPTNSISTRWFQYPSETSKSKMPNKILFPNFLNGSKNKQNYVETKVKQNSWKINENPLEFHLEIFSWTTSRASPQRAPPTQILRPVWPREPSTIQGEGGTSAVLSRHRVTWTLATWKGDHIEGSRLVFRISKERCRRWIFF